MFMEVRGAAGAAADHTRLVEEGQSVPLDDVAQESTFGLLGCYCLKHNSGDSSESRLIQRCTWSCTANGCGGDRTEELDLILEPAGDALDVTLKESLELLHVIR